MAVLLGEVANLVKPVHSVTVETVDITQLHPAVAVAVDTTAVVVVDLTTVAQVPMAAAAAAVDQA
jgi:hypothetical protein